MQDKTFVFYSDKLSYKAVDTPKGKEYYLKGYITTGDLDLVNDIVTKDCMGSMFSQFDTRSIKLDFNHETLRGKSKEEAEINKTTMPLGKFIGKDRDAKGIEITWKLNPTWRKFDEKGNVVMTFAEVWQNCEDGFYDAFSIAYVPTQSRVMDREGKSVRLLDNMNLLNVALTGNPINPGASMTAVMAKSLEYLEEQMKEQKGKWVTMNGRHVYIGDDGKPADPKIGGESTKREDGRDQQKLDAHAQDLSETNYAKLSRGDKEAVDRQYSKENTHNDSDSSSDSKPDMEELWRQSQAGKRAGEELPDHPDYPKLQTAKRQLESLHNEYAKMSGELHRAPEKDKKLISDQMEHFGKEVAKVRERHDSIYASIRNEIEPSGYKRVKQKSQSPVEQIVGLEVKDTIKIQATGTSVQSETEDDEESEKMKEEKKSAEVAPVVAQDSPVIAQQKSEPQQTTPVVDTEAKSAVVSLKSEIAELRETVAKQAKALEAIDAILNKPQQKSIGAENNAVKSEVKSDAKPSVGPLDYL